MPICRFCYPGGSRIWAAVPVPRQTDLICTPQRRAAMMPYATQNDTARVSSGPPDYAA
jgi:hypothetical protein